MLVLLPDVILLAQVDEVNYRLGSQEKQRVDELDLNISSVVVAKRISKKKEYV
jgi:hypothetical protein